MTNDRKGTFRSVARVVDSVRTVEGGGFIVRRPFPAAGLDLFDPFLLLDEMGPAEYAPGEAKGAPDHPHRGFETVTYLLEGQMEHKDSAGHSGKLLPGGVQWMTAGAGVAHSELPSAEMLERGGRMHGFQLWVNLPRRDKMSPPRYQDTPSGRIPVATSPDGKASVKVIAGEAMGKQAVIETRIPILYLHFTLRPGALIEQPVPKGYQAFLYVVRGEITVGAEQQPASSGQMAILANDGDVAILAGPPSGNPAEVLLIAGQPIREPVARYGPFVMNTREELVQAFEDYKAGRMGRINA